MDVLSTGRIRFTPFFEMNDPFEFSFSLHPRSNELVEAENDDYLFERAEAAQYMRSEFGSIGMLCLSQVRNSKLMWSHYSNNHRGYAIGFDEKHEFFNRETYITSPVYGKVAMSEAGFVSPRAVKYLPAPSSISMGQNTTDILFHKADCWAYEREIRVLRNVLESSYQPAANIHLFDFPPEAVTEVVIGIGASADFQKRILEICSEKYSSSRIVYAEIDSRSYKINFADEYPQTNNIWQAFFQ